MAVVVDVVVNVNHLVGLMLATVHGGMRLVATVFGHLFSLHDRTALMHLRLVGLGLMLMTLFAHMSGVAGLLLRHMLTMSGGLVFLVHLAFPFIAAVAAFTIMVTGP